MNDLPSIRHSNFCTVVWQQLICWLVSLVSPPRYLLDIHSQRTLESLPIHKGRRLHDRQYVIWCIFGYDDGHNRWQTSRLVVGAEIQKNCYFEAHKYYFSCQLGFIWCCYFMLHFRLPHKPMVWVYLYSILFSDLSHLLHKDIWHPHSSSGTSTSSFATTVEPTEFTEHFEYRKAVYSALWVQFSLVLCYLPFIVVEIVIVEANKRTFPSHLLVTRGIAATLLFFNSTLNPFLYCWKISEVRQAVKQTIRQALCCPWS